MGNSMPCFKGASYSPGVPNKHEKEGDADLSSAMPGEGGKKTGRRSKYCVSSIEDVDSGQFTNSKLVIDSRELPMAPGQEYINTNLAYTHDTSKEAETAAARKSPAVEDFFETKGCENSAFEDTETDGEPSAVAAADLDTTNITVSSASYSTDVINTEDSTTVAETTFTTATAQRTSEPELTLPEAGHEILTRSTGLESQDSTELGSSIFNQPPQIIIENDYELTADTNVPHPTEEETFGAVAYDDASSANFDDTESLPIRSTESPQSGIRKSDLFYRETSGDSSSAPTVHKPQDTPTKNQNELDTDKIELEMFEQSEPQGNVFSLPPPPPDFLCNEVSTEENRELSELVMKIHTVQDNIHDAVADVSKSDEEKTLTVIENLFAMTAYRDELSAMEGHHEEMFVMEEIDLPAGTVIEDDIHNDHQLRTWYSEAVAQLNTEMTAKLVATCACSPLLKEHRMEHSHLWKLKEIGDRELHEEIDSYDDARDHFEIMGRYNQIIREESTSQDSSPSPSIASSYSTSDDEEILDIEPDVGMVETIRDFIKSKKEEQNGKPNCEAASGVSMSSMGVDAPVIHMQDASVATEPPSLEDLEERMKSLDDGLLADLVADVTNQGDDDQLKANNIRNLLQSHMETTTKLRDCHHNELKRHEALLREKLRQKHNNNNNQDDGGFDESGKDQAEEEYHRAGKLVDESFMQKLASNKSYDEETVDDLLSQYRQEHISLLKQKDLERQRMTEKLREKLQMRNADELQAKQDNANLNADFYAKIWEIEQENNLTDEEILKLIKEHLKTENRRKRRSQIIHEDTAADYVRIEEEKREKIRKLRNEEKVKSDEKLKEKLRSRKQKPSHTDIPQVPPPRKQKNQHSIGSQGCYENVQFNLP